MKYYIKFNACFNINEVASSFLKKENQVNLIHQKEKMTLKARVLGTGSYLPKKVLTNADLEKMVETNDEIGPLQVTDQLIDVLFGINPVCVGGGAINNSHAHSHVADFIPTANFLG